MKTSASVLALVLALATAGPAVAAKGKAKAKEKAATTTTTPAQSPAGGSAAAVDAGTSDELKRLSVDALMTRAKQRHEQLEYDQVLPLVREVLAREGVPIEQTLDAYVLEGSCLAIIGNPIDAEAPFRRLLRGRPDFDLPVETPPKIMAVFRKVQAEEKAIAAQMEALTRKRVVSGMALLGEHPEGLKGGWPVSFAYGLKDPALAAEGVRVQYRRQGEPAYSSLALLRDEVGTWRGQIPGEWTANDAGIQMELYVEVFDKKGVLVGAGSATAPLVREVASGQIDRSSPPPLPAWSVWVGAGTSAALLAAGAGVGAAMNVVQAEYDAQADLAVTVPQPGTEIDAKEQLGFALERTANGLFIASGVAVVATVVAAVFFTDWEGRGEEAEAGAVPLETTTPVATAAGR